jgi:hypothetical protein
VRVEGTLPRLALYDGKFRPIAYGAQATDTGGYLAPIPEGAVPPLRFEARIMTGVGPYTIVVEGAAPPPAPPPEPPPPVDDVPDGDVRDIGPVADFRLDYAGDVDAFRFVAQQTAGHLVRISSSEVGDLVGDAKSPLVYLALVGGASDQGAHLEAGWELRLHVRSAGGSQTGAYRIEVLAAAPEVPPVPPVVDPLPDPIVLPDPVAEPTTLVMLPFDIVRDGLARPSGQYGADLRRRLFTDRSGVRFEPLAALAVRDRWIARDRGAGMLQAIDDSLGALDLALRRFGPFGRQTTGHAAWVARAKAAAVLGGGTRDALLAKAALGVGSRRPTLLAGVRTDGLVEAWVVVGFEDGPAGTWLLAIDPSAPGVLVRLTVEDGGIPQQGLGSGAMRRFALLGAETDALP